MIPDFNTSHVTVYPDLLFILLVLHQFQYISCYCLSAAIGKEEQKNKDFNTSHVTVYQFQYRHITPRLLHFNTSHVTVYLFGFAGHIGTLIFQYISCYCLSGTMFFFASYLSHFNTSHVTVYHGRTKVTIHHLLFQYISCYCLSQCVHSVFSRIAISIHLMLLFIILSDIYYQLLCLFQYISCYCLSVRPVLLMQYKSGFQYISCYCLSLLYRHYHLSFGYFNTSHVTVYLHT